MCDDSLNALMDALDSLTASKKDVHRSRLLLRGFAEEIELDETMTGLSDFAGMDIVLEDEDAASELEKQYSETDGAATLDLNNSQKMDSLNASMGMLSDG